MSKKVIESKKVDIIKILPFVVMIAIVPLIVFMKQIELDEISKYFWKGGQFNNDFFSYLKSQFIIFTTITAAVIFVVKKLKGKLRIEANIYHIFFGGYGLFVILSTVTAEHKSIAINGFADRYDGALV